MLSGCAFTAVAVAIVVVPGAALEGGSLPVRLSHSLATHKKCKPRQ